MCCASVYLLCVSGGVLSVTHGHASTFEGCCAGGCSLDCVRVVLYYYYGVVCPSLGHERKGSLSRTFLRLPSKGDAEHRAFPSGRSAGAFAVRPGGGGGDPFGRATTLVTHTSTSTGRNLIIPDDFYYTRPPLGSRAVMR